MNNRSEHKMGITIETNLDEVEEQLDRITAKLQHINVLLCDVKAHFNEPDAPPMVALTHHRD